MPVSVLSTCLHVFWKPQIEELICIKFCRRRSSYRNLWNRLQHPWFMISKKSVIINMTNIITHFDVPCTPSCKHESYIDSFNSYNSSFIGILIFPSFLMRCCHPDKLLKIIQLVSCGPISAIKLSQFLGPTLFCCCSCSPGDWHIAAEFKLSIMHTGYLCLLCSLKKKLFHLFINFWLCWVFIAMH